MSKITEGYINTSQHYLANFKKLMAELDSQKAGEALWGSMAQAIKAFAAKDGFQMASHGELKKFAKQMSTLLGDKSILDAFNKAESLHANFYDSYLDIDDIKAVGEEIEPTIIKILSMTTKV